MVGPNFDYDTKLWKGKDVLITGGGGYMGMRLCRKLLELGVKKVRIFDLRKPVAALSSFSSQELERVEFLQGDIRDLERVQQVVDGTDIVYHVASYGMSGGDMLREGMARAINVGGTENVVKACLASPSSSTLIFTSTCNVVFDGVTPLLGVDESYPYPPLETYMDYYSKTKRLAEEVILHANGQAYSSSSRKLATCALRATGIYGEGEERHFTRVIDNLRKGLCLFTFGDPKSLVEWVYIDNLLHAHLLAGEKLMKDNTESIIAGKAYFVSDWEPVNQWEFFRPLIEGLGYTYPSRSIPTSLLFSLATFFEFIYLSWIGRMVPHQPFMTRMEVAKIACPHYFSTEKVNKELGYKPLVTMKDGWAKAVAELRPKEDEYRRRRKEAASGSSFLLLFFFSLVIAGLWYYFLVLGSQH